MLLAVWSQNITDNSGQELHGAHLLAKPAMQKHQMNIPIVREMTTHGWPLIRVLGFHVHEAANIRQRG